MYTFIYVYMYIYLHMCRYSQMSEHRLLCRRFFIYCFIPIANRSPTRQCNRCDQWLYYRHGLCGNIGQAGPNGWAPCSLAYNRPKAGEEAAYRWISRRIGIQMGRDHFAQRAASRTNSGPTTWAAKNPPARIAPPNAWRGRPAAPSSIAPPWHVTPVPVAPSS